MYLGTVNSGQRTSRNDPIVQFEIQRWQWHFLAQPHDVTHGQLLTRRMYTVQYARLGAPWANGHAAQRGAGSKKTSAQRI